MRQYNKAEIFNTLDQLTIERADNLIITKLGGRILNTTDVSNRYEIFDIVTYLKNKITMIESNFNILYYELFIKGGRQYLRLISDEIEIGGTKFYKSFFILNSTDKSRKLNFNMGLISTSGNFYTVQANNASLTKKHLKGVTKAAEEASLDMDAETFNEQIESLKNLVDHKISLSKIREIILGDKDETPKINHKKYDAFKNSIRWSNKLHLTEPQRRALWIPSDKVKEVSKDNDFYMDAFWVLKVYLKIFNKQDSHIVKNETDRIMNMTQWAVRNSVLESLGI